MAPSHYLSQCWDSINWTLRNKVQWNFSRNSNIFVEKNALESVCVIASILSRRQWVNSQPTTSSVCFLNSSRTKLFIGNVKHISISHIIPPNWHNRSSWNGSLFKTRTYLFYIINIIGADVLATPRTRTSATMVFTMLHWNYSIPVRQWLISKSFSKPLRL